jgi:hypothetical protein
VLAPRPASWLVTGGHEMSDVAQKIRKSITQPDPGDLGSILMRY